MPIYKYLTQEGTKRFLSTWAMRITPPDQFNDPFEMRPPVDNMTYDEYSKFAFDAAREEFPKKLAEDFTKSNLRIPPDHPLCGMFTMYLLDELTASAESAFVKSFPPQMNMPQMLPALRQQFKQGVEQMFAIMPMFAKSAQNALRETMRQHAGVLCVSRNGNQPLMWAHYADEHRGAVIEFNEGASCFNRRRTEEDDFGYFRPVTYTSNRPKVRLTEENGDHLFQVLALTKAVEWEYEEESRLLWPLSHADRVVSGSIHLLSIPPEAVISITFGCRASAEFIEDVQALLRAGNNASHITTWRAEMDDFKFFLNYVSLSC